MGLFSFLVKFEYVGVCEAENASDGPSEKYFHLCQSQNNTIDNNNKSKLRKSKEPKVRRNAKRKQSTASIVVFTIGEMLVFVYLKNRNFQCRNTP